MSEYSPDDTQALNVAFTAGLHGEADLSESILRSRVAGGDPRIRFNLGLHEWRRGRFHEALAHLDGGGRQIKCFGSAPLSHYPTADRLESLDGATVLLRLEGGFGDEIFHVRFARGLADKGARVVVSGASSLMSVLARAPGVAAVVTSAAAEAGAVHADAWVPGMSALRMLEEKADDAPYLKALPSAKKKWRGAVRGPFKVGLRWRGSAKYEHEQFRAFPPEPLFALAEIPGVALYSLQRDAGSEMLPADSSIVDLGPLLSTWEDTAGVLANLDLLITSDTGVAHLSAAMGVPTWVIVPLMPYHLWAYPWKEETSPWYRRARVFRQTVFGNWDDPLRRVAEELRLLRQEVGS